MHRFNLQFRKYILLWAFLSMVVGYLAGKFNPQRVESLKGLVTPLLFLMVFIMLFPTDLSSLLKLKLYSFPILVSFMLSILSPILGIIVSRIIPQDFLFLKTGIVISSTVPPNAMLSAWTAFLEGDVLFTFIIQSFTFVYYLFLVPFGLKLLLVNHPYFSLVILVKNLFFLIVVPLVLAGCLRLIFREVLTGKVVERLKPLLSTASGIIELFIIMISIALRASIIAENPIIILWGVFTAALFYASGFIAAFYITKLFRFDYQTSIPLIYQNGSKNLPIAMVITITTFEHRAILGVAACILAQFPISALFYSIISRAQRPGLS